MNMRCKECGIPLTSAKTYCDVCSTMYYAVARQPGLALASAKWRAENEVLARRKRILLGEEDALSENEL
jgi:hypothetical protein